MSTDDFISSGGGRRRRTTPEASTELDLYKVDAVDAGERLEDAADVFENWSEILETFRSEFVERGNEFGGIAEMRADEGKFQEFVADFVFRHGATLSIAPKDQRRLVDYLSRYIFGYRGLEKYLSLPGLEEIIFNNWNDGFYIVHGVKKRIVEQIFTSEEDLLGFVRNIAASNGREINEANPALDAMLDDGSRVNSTLNGIAVGGTDLVIRKHRPELFTVGEYVQSGMLTQEALDTVGDLIRRGANSIVSGGTGTGKTTFLNTLGNEYIPPEDRLLIIEDTHELRIKTADTKYFQTRQRATGLRQSGTDITIRELFRFCLRKLPTRIIIGEVRGAEAYDALSAWNSGHEGSFMTIHANRAVTALSKLQQFARGVEDGMDDEGVRDLIAQAADIVVQLKRIHGKRRVSEIIQVFHPDDLRDAIGNDEIVRMAKEGLLRKVWSNCYVMTLFKLQNDQLVKVAEPLPLPGEID